MIFIVYLVKIYTIIYYSISIYTLNLDYSSRVIINLLILIIIQALVWPIY